MKRLFMILGRAALAVGFLLLVLMAGLAVITHTDRFREFLREQLVTTINDSVRGSVSLGRLEGSLWGNVILHNLAVRHEGVEILGVPRLRIAYSLLPLLWGRLQIFEVEGVRPSLRLVRDRDNQWNLVQAFSPKQPTQQGDSGWVVLLNSLSLREGNIDLRLAGPEPQSYSFKNLDLDSRLHIRPNAITVDVSRVVSRLTSPDFPEVGIDGALAYRDTGWTDTLEVSNLVLATGASRLQLNGKIAELEKPELHGKIAVERLAPSDVAHFIAGWPIKANTTGTIQIDGPLNSLVVDLDLAAAGAKLAADLRLNVAQEPPRYQATIDLVNFDVKTLFPGNDIAGILSGAIEAEGIGFDLSAIHAQGGIKMQSAAAAGWALGDISIEGRLRENVATVAGKLKSKMGGASWNGEISFKDKPAYDLALSVDHLDIQKTAGDGNGLEGNLNFKGTIKGTGFDPAALIARANLQILPSTIGPVRVQQGSLIAAVADQRIRITQGTLTTQDTMLTVQGDVGLDPQQNGRLDYRVRSENLTPWLALADLKGSGALELTGRATGNIAALESQGKLKFASLRLEDTVIKSGNIDFALRRLGTEFLPQGTMQVQLAEIQAGVALQRLDGSIGLSSHQPYEIRLDLKASDQSNRTHTLVAQVDYQPEVIVARLDQLRLNLDDGVWQLSRRATITQSGDSFDIEGFMLNNRAQQVALNGRFATSGEQNLTVNIEGFPVGGLSAFMTQPIAMTGTINIRAQVGGTAAAPVIVASLNLADATIAGQHYGGAAGAVTYRDRIADLKLTVRQDATHELIANGRVPVILSWSPEWQLEAAGDMNVRVRSEGLSMAFLNAFSGDATQNITGNISLDVLARGPVTQPVLRGTARVSNGAATLKPLGLQVSSIAADAKFDGQTVTLREISARAKDGQLNGSGVIALKDYMPENFKLSLAASRWPAIATRRYQATVAANIEIQGPLTKPSLTGQIDVLNADLRPDLAFLSRGKTSLTRDETIVIAQHKTAGQKRSPQEIKEETQPDNELLKNARLDMTVVMPNQVWIRHPDANIELSGKIRAIKQAGGDIALTGTINVVRGWIAFQRRRFNLVRGAIQFTGGETINPVLDILARYRLPEYQVEVIVSGPLDKPTLALRSEPPLEQADILALLLFGKPVNALDRTEQTTLQQSAVDLASGFAAATIGSAVSQALGLDRLGLDIGELDFSGGQIGFGRYVGDSTYFSVSQHLSGEAGREVSIEYRIGPDWKIVTSTSTTGTSGIGILWHKRY
ncbi:MAG: translocation/assembly module TamB domain-containing protein [Candidatus Binatia bacterium]